MAGRRLREEHATRGCSLVVVARREVANLGGRPLGDVLMHEMVLDTELEAELHANLVGAVRP
jgi:hypothetical protein